MNTGTFVVSLDLELFWGMTDKVSLDAYRERLLGERHAIPQMLSLFDQYGIHATWSTMGMLACSTKAELMASLPPERPHYSDTRLSTYEYLAAATIGENEEEDPYHFGASLIREIMRHKNQEIGSHTFSHFYCQEEGATPELFRKDLEAARTALQKFGASPVSLVLPRNQWQEAYRAAATEAGILCYRGNQRHFLYVPRKDEDQQNLLVRALRLIDHYLPLSGDHIYTHEDMIAYRPYDVPASMFLRPYHPLLRLFEGLRRWRITSGMTRAAREGKLFHLWWHPYNLGLYTKEGLATLEHVLKHYVSLRERYGMESKTMAEVAASL